MKFYILAGFALLSFSAQAQNKNPKPDSSKPARQIIVKDQGEKQLPTQLKQTQIQKSPEDLKMDSTAARRSANRQHKTKCSKHRKSTK